MSNTAQISMELVDTADGDFSPDQVQAAQNAIDGLTGLPGNNMDATVENTDTAPGENYNTASNPLMVVEIGTQADVDAVGANCTGAIACTQPYVSNGVTVGSKTVVLQAYATTYLQQVLTHEFGHGVFGWGDCSAANCYTSSTATGSMMNAAFYANEPSAPTSCDSQHAQGCGH